MVKETTAKTSNERTRGLKRWNPPKPFSKENQPSPEAKAEGRARKKEAKRMLDDILLKNEVTVKEFLEQYMDKKEKKVKWKVVKERYEPKQTLSIKEAYSVNYIYNQIIKWWLDWMNRHVSYAPQKSEIWGDEDNIKPLTITFK